MESSILSEVDDTSNLRTGSPRRYAFLSTGYRPRASRPAQRAGAQRLCALELARALEKRGFESVWAPEHSHIPLSRKTPFPGGGDPPKQYYDAMVPFVVLAAASQVTRTIKLGTGVLLVQQRGAIQTAKLVASIDR
jgi:alkanesulfonate monooxygenase SsuD/methylene tetrahydromethanopterin reductase-like flavin-dependent oxidoreductase (luciferase family)